MILWVPRAGIEPAPANADNILSVACIPISPPRRLDIFYNKFSFGGLDDVFYVQCR